VQSQVSINQRRAALLLAASVVAVTLLGVVIGLIFGVLLPVAVVAFVVGLLLAFVAWRTSDRVACSMAGARPLATGEQPRLANLVDGLCAAAGVPVPRLFIVDDDVPNSFSVGRGPKHASIVVTKGLLTTLDRVELEGVVAHELSHIRSRDIEPATLAVTLLGFGLPVTGPLLRIFVGTDREHLADVAGVQLTRYPPGLVAALDKLRADARAVSAARRPIAHLWLEPPTATLDDRIAALREL
jgi:heat shock protein HtpX